MYLECRDVSKAFAGTPVLQSVSFSLARGECLALLGGSGCGKTTLLNIVAGFLNTDEGRVTCGGETLDDPASRIFRPVAQRRFSMVFQDFSLWPHLTVGENVAYGLKLRRVARSERDARTLEALRRVGLEAVKDRAPSTLSGGQQQRVAIARALVVEPRVVLLDEPLSALDAHLRESLRDELGKLIRTLGMTAIYVTHDQTEALALAHRVAVMRSGVIEQIGTPEDIYREPATAYVASFLGGANVLGFSHRGTQLCLGPHAISATVASNETTNHFATPHLKTRQGLCALRKESVRVRPRSVSADTSTHGLIALHGRCDRVRFLGDRYEVVVAVPNVGLISGYAAHALAPESEVSLEFAPDALREVRE